MTSTAPYHLPSNSSNASLEAPSLPPYTEQASSISEDGIKPADPTTTTGIPSPNTIFATTAPRPNPNLRPNTAEPSRPPRIPLHSRGTTLRLLRPRARRRQNEDAAGNDNLPIRTRPTPVVRLADPTRDARPENRDGDVFEITGRSLFSRAVDFRVPGLGAFGWRYGNAGERVWAGADSLLVCEVFPPEEGENNNSSNNNSHPGRKSGRGTGNKEPGRGIPRRIAQLVRNETLRSPGSARASAGNGGRLVLDLRGFAEKDRLRCEWLVVGTAVAMLKREADRRRALQVAVLGTVLS
ncbi:hypothetical protein F4861DRAFT_537733 [Xylaria intraflava]|nr:hypothetical protein F4861DRAFT_537733 [Xylaria intraflava]